MKKTWKKLLAVGCALSMVMSVPGMSVLAEELQEETIVTEAQVPEKIVDSVDSPDEDVADVTEVETVSLNEAENVVGEGEIQVGEGVTATFDADTGAVEFTSQDGELWRDWVEKLGVTRYEIKSIKVASGTVYLPADSSGYYFDEYVMEQYYMFGGLENLTSLDLSSFDTSNVETMFEMFRECRSLTNLNLSSFGTSNVINMEYMFGWCSSLTNLDLSGFDTSNVTSMRGMFRECSSLKNLDLSSFDTSNVSDMEDMFSDCFALQLLKTPKENIINVGLPCIMYDEAGNAYVELPTLSESIVLTNDVTGEGPIQVGDGVTATFDSATGAVEITSQDGELWQDWYQKLPVDIEEIKSIKVSSGTVYLPVNSSGAYYDEFEELFFIEMMFGSLWNLNSLDLSSFDTSNVTDMSHMFYGCRSLASLDLSSFDTSNVTDMSSMFSYCSNLTNLDLSSFDTSNVSSMEDMFTGCSSLQLLKTPKNNIINAELPCIMYDEAGNAYEELPTSSESIVLTSDVTGEDSFQVGDGVTATFDSDTGAVEFYSDGGTLWSNWLEASGIDVTGIRSIKAVSGTVYLPEDSSWIFSVCLDDDCIISNLEELDLSRFDTSNVTNMGCMFWGCNSLTNLELSSFDTSNVTLMYGMFINCSSLTNLDLSSFDTSNVTEMEDLFAGCWSLTNLNLSSFNTSNVTNMYAMFNDCRNLTNLDLSSFNTSNVTLMYCMFEGCNRLTNLDLSGFETSNAISMWNMFEGCSSLTNLDLSSFDTSNVSYMEDMFSGCSSLQLLKTPKRNTTNVALPCIMYDEAGNAYEELPSSSESIVLTRNKPIVKPDISDSEITLSATSYTYDGKAKEPTVTVKNGDAVLTSETDYTVSYADNTNAGTATVTVTGTGNYKGEKSVIFTINKADAQLSFAESAVTKKTTDAAFTNTLTKTTDGTVTFASSDTGVASVDRTSGLVTIKGIGTVIITATASEGQNYKAGSAEYMLTVEDGRVDISGLSVTLSTTSYTYNGKAKKPTVTVKNGDAVLTSGTDYTVSYADNTNAGTATVKVTGTGNYKGEKSVAFTINKADANLTFAESALTKKTTDAAFTNALTKTTDGTVTFASGDTNVATVDSSSGLVTIKGIGTTTVTAVASEGKNYKAGSAEYTLTVEDGRIDISGLTATLSVTSYTYDGKAKQPTVTVKNGDAVLTSGTDYTVSYVDNTNAGTATVEVTGTGNYKGEKSVTFTINKADAKLAFAESTITKKTTDAAFTNTLTKTTDGTVTFKSGDTKVAAVDSTSGLVTIKGAGATTITATASEGQNYKAGSAAYTLTIEAPAPTPAASGFSDVQDPNHAYYKAIYWAAEEGITKGYPDGTFGINKSCTRGEMIMFLWRYAGKPAPKTVSKSPFKDVAKTHAFYKAILWASQKGITKGYPDGTFGIDRNVSRGECMMFLWRVKGKPAPKAVAKSPFKDVATTNAFYKAILWGYQNKITTGYTSGAKKGTFGINENCTRGQIVTFLYRAK